MRIFSVLLASCVARNKRVPDQHWKTQAGACDDLGSEVAKAGLNGKGTVFKIFERKCLPRICNSEAIYN